jgi:hypothetical protein
MMTYQEKEWKRHLGVCEATITLTGTVTGYQVVGLTLSNLSATLIHYTPPEPPMPI